MNRRTRARTWSPPWRAVLRTLAWALIAFVLLPSPPLTAQDGGGPRPGKYRIMSYGRTGAPPLYLGYFVLEGKTYKAFLPGDKPSGEGTWSFDAARRSVVWESGPYQGTWGGEFTVEREGKTHKIRLKSTTIATNSSD